MRAERRGMAGKRGRRALGLVRAVALAASLLIAREGQAVTLLGEAPFVSPGQIESLPFTLFGEQVTPRLDLDGFIRVQIPAYKQAGETTIQIVPQLDLQLNLQLTATQRVFTLLRPIENGDREPSMYEFQPDSGWTTEAEAKPAALFYEGQPFKVFEPYTTFPLDFTLAAGRIPFFLHNGLFFENIFDGFALSKNNIQLGNVSNLNLYYFLTVGETQGGLTVEDRPQQRKNVMGLGGDLDWYDYFVEFTLAGSYANARTQQGEDLDRVFLALSVTRTFGTEGAIALRALGNSGNSTSDGGALFALETSKIIWGALAYANVFASTRDWLPLSVEGSALTREGILFNFDRLVAFPQLNPRGSDSIGGALGMVFWPKARITYTPEIGFLVDNAKTDSNDQAGAAFQVQIDVAHLIVPDDDLKRLQSLGLFYGMFVRLTAQAILNTNLEVAKRRLDGGERLELIYRF